MAFFGYICPFLRKNTVGVLANQKNAYYVCVRNRNDHRLGYPIFTTLKSSLVIHYCRLNYFSSAKNHFLPPQTTKKMKTISTIAVLAFALISTFYSNNTVAQCQTPKMVFANPVRIGSAAAGTTGAEYKFTNVISGVDAYIKIKNIVGGASLVNMDETSVGYYNAWQPVVSGPSAPAGNISYIEWEVTYKTTSGSNYTFSCMDMSGIDVDGDNVRIREFIQCADQNSASTPSNAVSALTMQNISGNDWRALGPVSVRNDIDTTSDDVQINFYFTNVNKFTVKTGAMVNSTTLPGTAAPSRYHCLYFQKQIDRRPTGVLPVVYGNLNANFVNNGVQVNWTTQHETNNSHFEIERSFNNMQFEQVGVALDGIAGTSGSKAYQFTDNSSELKLQKVVYYRLKQVDVDGRFTYSSVLMVRLQATASSNNSVSVYPNPFNTQLNVRFNSNENGTGDIKLLSVSGHIMSTKSFNIGKGTNNVQLEGLNNLAKGVYIARVTINGTVVDNQKVIKN